MISELRITLETVDKRLDELDEKIRIQNIESYGIAKCLKDLCVQSKGK
jgi:tetrahydromethanopterin S-methyltransferase subunit G